MTASTPGSPLQVPATWDAVAAGYAEEIVPLAEAFVEEVLRLLPVGPNDRVLDVAAGPGSLALRVSQRCASVVAVDFSAGMIEQLRVAVERERIANVRALVMDAQALELPDQAFDVAFCLFGFMFFPDRAKAFRELFRVLAPGGRAVIATWAPIDRRPLMGVGFEALAEALPDLPPPTRGDLQHPDECIAETTSAGFVDVAARTATASLRIDSPGHYLRVLARSGAPFSALRRKLGDEAWAAAEVRMLEGVRRRLPTCPVNLDAEAILTFARRPA